MRAQELLQRYRKGERDFRRLDLRDSDFQGADLAGADFSECNLQGTNFTRSNLTGACFYAAKTGLSRTWTIGLALGGFLLAGVMSPIVAFFVAFSLAAAGVNFASPQEVGLGVMAIAVLYTTLAIAIVRKGVAATWKILGAAPIGLVVIALASGVLASFFAPNTVIINIFDVVRTVSAAIALAALIMTVAPGPGIVAGTLAGADIVPDFLIGLISVFGAAIGAAIGAFGAAYGAAFSGSEGYWVTTVAGYWFITIGIPVILTILGIYLGLRPLRGDRCDRWWRHLTLKLISVSGTRFTQANLTDADFSNAVLKHANFQKALQDRTCFQNASYLILARGCTPDY